MYASETGSGVESQSAGALADGAGQGQDPIASALPEFFLHPLAESLHVLVTGPPPIISAFDQVQHTAGIRSGSIVIDRPEVALVVEGQFLGIAQSLAEDL